MASEVRQNMIQDSAGAPVTKFEARGGYVFEQIAGRGTTDIAEYTLVAKDSAGHLVPLDDSTVKSGKQIPVGILRGTIPAADIVAADVTDVELYVKAENFDEASLVLEGTVDLDDSITVNCTPITIATADATSEATVYALANAIKTVLNNSHRTMTLREYLSMIGITFRTVDPSMGYES